jgi:hypothetical protein
MRARSSTILIAVLSLASVVCDQPFDPREQFGDQLVVFYILSTERVVQIVRVERSYMPSGYEPLAYQLDNFISNATVIVDNGSVLVRSRDTILARADTSRFKFPLRAYVFSPLVAQNGKTYEITVQSSQFGRAVGATIVPDKAAIALGAGGIDVMENPGSHEDDSIPFEILLSDFTKGYIGRLFVDYRVYEEEKWIDGRIEVPYRYTYAGLKDFKYVTYAQLTRRSTTKQFIMSYTSQIYNATLIEAVYVRHPGARIVFNRIVFQFLQVEQNLYNYYMLTHSYNDQHSIRLDNPNYSNITGGVGLVGAYAVDSLAYPLPQNFVYNRL